MFASDQYQLLDFGNGRKLERFGPYVLNRPAPAAARTAPRHGEYWTQAHAIYQPTDRGDHRGRWTLCRDLPQPWTIRHGRVTLELQCSESGNVGVFPEQAENWQWLTRQLRRAARTPRLLNLFAFTGGSTLAAAAAGAEVVHVDAAAGATAWARRNAALSGLADAPIRWITEDAGKFARRELKRGNQYDAVVLDPPSYGHGPKRESWKIDRDLSALLEVCSQLTRSQRTLVLLTCHSPGFGPAELAELLSDTFAESCQGGAIAKRLFLCTLEGRRLSSGVVARWAV